MFGTALLLAFFLASCNIALWALFSTLLYHPQSEGRSMIFALASFMGMISYIILQQWGVPKPTLWGTLAVSSLTVAVCVVALKRSRCAANDT